jgi:flagellar hook-associated protein 2
MAGISLGGLSSGLDTQSIVDQLIAIDRAPETRMKLQQSALAARKEALTDIGTRLRNLSSAVKDLGSTATWANTQSLEVSDSTKLTATRLSGAAPGGHEINVTSLARAEQRSYTYTASDTTLQIGAATIPLTASDDGAAAADKINANSDSPVYAVFVQDPLGDTTKDRLVLTRKDTGEYQQADMAVTGAAWTAGETYTAGVNATYTVDGGTQQESRSNVLKSAVPGLQLTLKSAGTTSVTVGAPAPDQDAIKAKVQAFVDQYNSTIDLIRSKLTEKRVPNATSDTDARKGALFADPQLTGLLSQLRSAMSDKTGIGGAITSLADLGVSTGTASGGAADADAVAGKLKLDVDKLTDALTDNRTAAKSFLTDATNGIAAKLTGLLDPVSRASTGLIDLRANEAGSESSDIDDRIAALEARLAQRQERLTAQFTAMEQALAQSRSQGSWLSSQLG